MFELNLPHKNYFLLSLSLPPFLTSLPFFFGIFIDLLFTLIIIMVQNFYNSVQDAMKTGHKESDMTR